MTTGPAQPAVIATDRPVMGGPAIPIRATATAPADRPAGAGPAQPVYLVTDADVATGRFRVAAGPPVPMYNAGGTGLPVGAGPAQPVYVVSGALTSAAASSLLTGLSAYWKMDEASGQALDSGPNGYALTATASAPTSAAGVVNTARAFSSASSQGFSIADNAGLSGGDRDFHFTCWVYPTLFSSGNGKYILSKGEAGSNQREYWLVILTVNNRAQFYVSATGSSTLVSVEAAVNMSASNWYFIDCGHDSVNNQIFCRVNNGTKYTTSHSGGVFDGSASFRISGVLNPTQFWFDGRIDEVGRWNRLLTDAEIATLYNGGAGKSYPFL